MMTTKKEPRYIMPQSNPLNKTLTKHNWVVHQNPDRADWLCLACGKLDFSVIADNSQDCRGSITRRIESEIEESHGRVKPIPKNKD
jgi:hypothetical protein